jgi:hypothetical protein
MWYARSWSGMIASTGSSSSSYFGMRMISFRPCPDLVVVDRGHRDENAGAGADLFHVRPHLLVYGVLERDRDDRKIFVE